MSSSFTLLASLTICLSLAQSFPEVTQTIMNIAMKIEAPATQPVAGPLAIIPVMTVKNAAIARAKRILSSKDSLTLSQKGGTYGRGLTLHPKNLVLLLISFSSPIIPVSASVANFFKTPYANPYYFNLSRLFVIPLLPVYLRLSSLNISVRS